MSDLLLAAAQTIVAETLRHARGKQFMPMAVVVLDRRGALAAAATEDGCSLGRWQIALGKAYGALFLGMGSRRLGDMAVERPHFIGALANIPFGGLVPIPGGVLIRSQNEIIGAIGVSGDASDNDEAAAIAGAAAAGFVADAG